MTVSCCAGANRLKVPLAAALRGAACAMGVLGLSAPAARANEAVAVPLTSDGVTPWLIAAMAVLAALITLVALILLARRNREFQAARQDIDTAANSMNEVFAAGHAGTFTWLADGEVVASPGLASVIGSKRTGRLTYSDVAGVLDRESAETLGAAVNQLRRDGEGFELLLSGSGAAGYLYCAGRRVDGDAGKADVLWLQNVTRWEAVKVQAQRESRLLRELLDTLPLPVWSRDRDLKITECNTAYVRAVEAASRDDVVAEGREIAEGDLATAARTLASRAVEAGSAQRDSYHVVVDGSRRLLEVTERPAVEGRSVGFALDTTAQEETQTEIRRLVEAQDEVLENLAIAIGVFGPDRRLSFFNAAYVNMWKHDEEWLETNPELGEVLDVLRERRLIPETGDFSAFRDGWLSLFTSLLEPRRELQHLPDGRAIWIVCSPHPLGGLLFTFEDVTDKLALERSYNTLIEVQRASLDNLAEGVAVFGEDGCLHLSNPVFQKMWGLADDFLAAEPHIGEVVEKCKRKLDYGGDWERFKRSYVARITGRMTRSGRLYRKDDMVFAYNVVPMPDGGVLLSFRDITDTTRVARALRERNEALEAADRIKSEFVANISYELRTPLNAIVGFTEILNNQYFGELNPSQTEYVDGILEASQRLIALIDDILDLAVIEAGRMVLDIKTLNVRELLETVVNLTGEWAREQEIKLRLRCPADIGTIEADERRIKHALFNLVSNAIKYTPPEGEITVEARRKKAEIALIVSDSGVGIPEADQDRVFEKFARGPSPEGRSVSAGLGLALVKSFVELHGGRVELVSAPDKGTSVICALPLRAKGAARPSGKTSESRAKTAAIEAAE